MARRLQSSAAKPGLLYAGRATAGLTRAVARQRQALGALRGGTIGAAWTSTSC